MSADGYHHHLGTNTWRSRGAPPENAVGLRAFVVVVPTHAAQQHVVARLEAADVAYSVQDHSGVCHDPSRNRIILTSRASLVAATDLIVNDV